MLENLRSRWTRGRMIVAVAVTIALGVGGVTAYAGGRLSEKTVAEKSEVTKEEAQRTALAQVEGATEEDLVESEFETEEGIAVYEFTIEYDGYRYEIEISAVTGKVISYEKEPFVITGMLSQTDDGTETGGTVSADGSEAGSGTETGNSSGSGAGSCSSSSGSSGTSAGSSGGSSASTSNSTSVSSSGSGSTSTSNSTSTSSSGSSGASTSNSTSVSSSGSGSSSSASNTAATSGEITLEEAKAIALAQVKGATAANIVEAKSDTEDGIPVYEIEIIYGGYEYEFSIAKASGKIIEKDVEAINK